MNPNNRWTSRLFNYIPLFLLPLVFTSCGGISGVDKSKTIFVQLSSEPVSLDPSLAEDGISLRILSNTMDGVMGYDGAGVLENRLAISYGVSPGWQHYEFTIRPDAVWSDGVKVTADDFITGIRRALEPATGAKLAPLLFPIRGARQFHAGALKAEQLGVKNEGGRLVIDLEQPVSYWLDVMTLPIAMPQRADVLKKNSGAWPDDGPVTGPYRIATRKLERYTLLRPNDRYWKNAGGNKQPPAVLFQIITDDTSGISLFERGKIDILMKIPTFELKRIAGKGVLHRDPFVATYYISFNVSKPPFNDRNFRRAVAGVIRKDEIIGALNGAETPASTWIPKGLEGSLPYEDLGTKMADSITLVREQLKKKRIPPVAAMFDGGTRNQVIMEKIQSDVLKKLGLELSLTNMDWKAYVKMLSADAPPLFRFGRQAPFMDPISHLEAFKTGDPNNFSHWSDRTYDKLVEEIVSMPRGPKREALIRKADEILVRKEAVVVPVYHYIQTHAVSPRIHGFRVNAFGLVRFDELSIYQF